MTPTLAPGSVLPTDAECASRVRAAPENRPSNTTANRTGVLVGVDYQVETWDPSFGMAGTAAALSQRINGHYTGTTDEIIQWGSCKWGFDTDLVRAVAVVESSWNQAKESDLVNGVPQSFGLLQVKRSAHLGTYPASAKSTAWNVDYALAYRRACYEGLIDWLHDTNPAYGAGDEWGCVGHWYSGGWLDAGARRYIEDVRRAVDERAWTRDGF